MAVKKVVEGFEDYYYISLSKIRDIVSRLEDFIDEAESRGMSSIEPSSSTYRMRNFVGVAGKGYIDLDHLDEYVNVEEEDDEEYEEEGLLESPDLDTLSGFNDYFSNLMHVVIDRLGLNSNPLNWDVKGNKFTLRIRSEETDKTVVVTPLGLSKLQARVCNVKSHQKKDVQLSGQSSSDIVQLVNEVRSI